MAPGTKQARPARPFYGWTIVCTGTLGGMLIYGIRHSFAVFFTPILEEFGWSRGNVAVMMSLNIFVYGWLAPLAGALADRWRPRVLVPAGLSVLAVATAGCAWAGQLWHFYLFFGVLMPLGSALAGWPILAPALMHWFVKRRGLVLGVGAMGGGGMSFAFAILVQYVILLAGWRATFLILACLVLVVLLPLYLAFFYFRPQDRGLSPYGAGEKPVASARDGRPVRPPVATRDWSLGGILRSAQLWLLVGAYALYWGVSNYMLVAHQVRFAEDAGYSRLFSVSIFALFGATLFVGQSCGFLSDWLGREVVATLAAALSVLALVALSAIRDTSQPWLLYVYAIAFGLGAGLFTPTVYAGTADIFGGPYFGIVGGLLLTGMGIGAVFGPWLGGYIYDATGSYLPAFALCMGCTSVSCLAFWVAAPRKATRAR